MMAMTWAVMYTRQFLRGRGEDEAAGKFSRRKIEAEARQQYCIKFMNSVYEIQIVAIKHNTQSIIDHVINNQQLETETK